jgi:putative cell wall-binding protein
VEGALEDGGRDVRRIGSPDDATATAAAIAEAVGGDAGVAVLVNGSRFADGVSAAALAAGRGWPILLTTTEVVPQASVDAWRSIGVDRIVLMGGTGVIAENIERFVGESGGCETGGPGSPCHVERVAGRDRYATSVAAAEQALDVGDRSVERLLLGTGANYPDTLASGPLAARLGGIALLVDGTGRAADGASRSFLSANADDVDDVAILGGPGAVTSAADRAIQEALGLR